MKLFEGKLLMFRNDPTERHYEFHTYGVGNTVMISEMSAKRYDILFADLNMLIEV